MAKSKTTPSAFDDILNSAKSESKAVKKIIENKPTKDTTKKVDNQEINKQNDHEAENQDKTKLIIKPVTKETRSKKTNILLPPTLDKAVKQKAKKEGVSLNEVVNQLLEMWIES